jgi:hypothetical protein
MKYIEVQEMMRSARFGVRGHSVNDEVLLVINDRLLILILCRQLLPPRDCCTIAPALHLQDLAATAQSSTRNRPLYVISAKRCVRLRSEQSPHRVAPVFHLKPAKRRLVLKHISERSLHCLRYHHRTTETCQTEIPQYREYVLRQHFRAVEAVPVSSCQRAHAAKVDLRKGIAAENNLIGFSFILGTTSSDDRSC